MKHTVINFHSQFKFALNLTDFMFCSLFSLLFSSSVIFYLTTLIIHIYSHKRNTRIPFPVHYVAKLLHIMQLFNNYQLMIMLWVAEVLIFSFPMQI